MKKLASIVLGSSVLLSGALGVTPTFASGIDYDNTKLISESNEKVEITPFAIFSPDRCIYARTVEKFGSGWYVNGIFLDKAAKHGLQNPEVGDNIDIMVDTAGRVVGWKVNNSLQ